MLRFRLLLAVAALGALPAVPAAALTGAGAFEPHPAQRVAAERLAPVERARADAARPGAFCVPGGCRPGAGPVVWNGAAFGVALLAIGWQARRRPPTSP